eukprot:CAMPEP_0201868134 /NCGR_PEP_ID=MMETSP0902-20130614/2148_1 /ASSEMBLY_ACC=CAM_ASM_000551 /TAXON_ID=420261 /ORGANISM="Thalassiosira antarctica, Strain CCMP982" /LENGTH=773 /DNA_ID=CAMNT_0048393441 /DNA_START=125 /DNA_END=2446 /DNA_ORIENTATION=-
MDSIRAKNRMDGEVKSNRRESFRDGQLKSIRRASFIESFGIKEVEEDERSVGSIDNNRHGVRKSLTLADLDDIDIDITTSKHGNGDMNVSLLDSFIDTSEPLRPTSSSNSGDSQKPPASPPKNFAGGGTRRKGDKQRRMRQRFGNENKRASTESRRASTGTMSVQESFGDMSLQSFTSINSFSTSGGGGDQNGNVCIGNLIFVTDDEMEKLMYGDGNAAKKTINSTEEDSCGLGPRRSSVSSVSSNLSASLPPSAILGTGAFSTVRLAWRKTPDDTEEKEKSSPDDDNDEGPSRTSLQDIRTVENDTERDRRRSIVRVQSKHSDVVLNDPQKGELVAVKIIQKSILKQMKTIQKGSNNRLTVLTAFDNIEREIATMKRLKHPNLVRLFEVIDSVESDRMHMVLEYVSLGEILSHVEGTNKYTRMRYRKKVRGLTEKGHFDEKHAALYFVDIMHGLAYLHRNRICHRDLKPENILLCASGVVKISDFGVSHMFEDEKARESYMLTALDDNSVDDFLSDFEDNDDNIRIENETGSPTHLSKRESDAALTMSSKYNTGILKKTEGTWCFWSPEMCSTESKGFSGYACDLWAAGVCLYIFTTGMLPFFSLIPSEVFDMIAKAEVPYEGLVLSNELKDLLGKMLNKDPSTRAGVGDCLKHEFCANARMERIDELGTRFRDSEEHIILSKIDVDMALSVTMPQKPGAFRRISKRFSAPAASITAPAAPASATKLNNDPNLTTWTETSVEVKAPNSSDKPKSKKRDILASKFKLKKWWRN